LTSAKWALFAMYSAWAMPEPDLLGTGLGPIGAWCAVCECLCSLKPRLYVLDFVSQLWRKKLPERKAWVHG